MDKIIGKWILGIFAVVFILLNHSRFHVSGVIGLIACLIILVGCGYLINKYKGIIVYPAGFLAVFIIFLLFSKSELLLLFSVGIILLINVFFINRKSVIITTVTSFIILFLTPFALITLLLILDFGERDIYPETHYYTDDGHEIYAFSAGAMDGMHYSVGKGYEIVNLAPVLRVYYQERNEVSEAEYNQVLEGANCRLAN